MSFLSSFFSN